MAPPRERFEAGDPPVGAIDRLVAHGERAFLDAVPEVGLDLEPCDGVVPHPGIEELADGGPLARARWSAVVASRRISSDCDIRWC